MSPVFNGMKLQHYVQHLDMYAKSLRLKGHKLETQWSGEYGEESTSTGTCSCGKWSETCSSQSAVRDEYRHHLAKEILDSYAKKWQFNSASELLKNASDEQLFEIAQKYKP